MLPPKTATLALALLLLVGCGSKSTEGDAGSSGASTESGSPAVEEGPVGSSVNPVDVLRQVPDCKIGSGVETGEPDVNGILYASCDIEDVEFTEDGEAYTTDVGVTARAVDPADAMTLGYEDAASDDSHKVIFGDGFYLVLTGSPAVFGTGAVDVKAISTAVGGQVS